MRAAGLLACALAVGCGTDFRSRDGSEPDDPRDPTRPDAGEGSGSSADASIANPDATEPSTGNPLAVVVGYGSRRASSSDGLTWANFVQIDPNGGDDDNLLRGVGFGGGTFVAVGGSSAGLSFTTTDGKTWSNENRTARAWLGGVAYLGTAFVAAGGNGIRVRSLDRGATWRDDAGYQPIHYRDVASNGAVVVAAGHTYDTSPNLGLIASTTDGITWTERKRGGQTFHRVVAGNGVFVAGGTAGGVSRSSDGATWTDVSLAGSGYVELAFDGTRFIATVNGNHFESTTGTTWAPRAGGRAAQAFIAGRYLSVDWPASIYASQNLADWTEVFAQSGSGLTRVVVGRVP